MIDNTLEKPCLVKTSQGFSVSYKNRFLYSKYSPKRAITQVISSLQLLPNTLILCASPSLWYGLQELEEKLPENCMILGIETDSNLYELAKNQLEQVKNQIKTNAQLFPIEEIKNIVEIIIGKRKISIEFPKISNFKRAIMIEMSAGTIFNKDFYKEIDTACENAIASFWKNRITLTKLGRLFSKNTFENISNIANSFDIKNIFGKIEKPILVIGAGESSLRFIEKIEKIDIKLFEKFFVLAVDAIIPTLHTKNIKIDAIVAVESQLAIEKAYIGANAKNSIMFADISSRKQVTKHTKNAVFYFASEYADTNFFDSLKTKSFFPPIIPPLGSVGLSATYLALLLRKNIETCVFVVGLDFSFSLGTTHAKGTPTLINRLSTNDKLHTAENYDSAFRIGTQKVLGKNNEFVHTDIALNGYKESFKATFCNQKNLFDIGECGLDLGLKFINLNLNNELNSFTEFLKKNNFKNFDISTISKNNNSKEILSYLESEEKTLERIKELLIYGNDVAHCGKTLESELEELISNREYLFLHFPDGFRFDVKNLSLLKRIRTEIDFFLKIIRKGISK